MSVEAFLIMRFLLFTAELLANEYMLIPGGRRYNSACGNFRRSGVCQREHARRSAL